MSYFLHLVFSLNKGHYILCLYLRTLLPFSHTVYRKLELMNISTINFASIMDHFKGLCRNGQFCCMHFNIRIFHEVLG